MKFAFSAPTSDLTEQSALVTQYRPAGFDGLQLKKGQFQEYIEAPQRFIDEWGGHAGVASGLIFGGPLDESGISALQRVIEFASAVDCERIIFCHSLPRQGISTADIKCFAVILSDLGKEAGQHGVRLSLHHHYNQPVMHRGDFDVFFNAVQDRSVGLTVDTAHLVKSGINDLGGLIRDFDEFIDNFHIKDFADGEFRVLGQGTIDFEPVFAEIRAIGFDGWLCADEESGGDINETLDHSYQVMRAAFFSAPTIGT